MNATIPHRLFVIGYPVVHTSQTHKQLHYTNEGAWYVHGFRNWRHMNQERSSFKANVPHPGTPSALIHPDNIWNEPFPGIFRINIKRTGRYAPKMIIYISPKDDGDWKVLAMFTKHNQASWNGAYAIGKEIQTSTVVEFDAAFKRVHELVVFS